jgi:hypothetical protein
MDIFRLLKTGELDGLLLAEEQSNVIAAMQQVTSERVTILEMNGVLVALSDGIEAHFIDGRMSNLIIKMAHYWGNSSLTIGSLERKLHRRTSLERTIRLLDEVGVEWKFFQKYCCDKRVELITEGSASLEFIADAGHIIINRIHLTEGEVYSDNPCKAEPFTGSAE